jgi:hypothetical protein
VISGILRAFPGELQNLGEMQWVIQKLTTVIGLILEIFQKDESWQTTSEDLLWKDRWTRPAGPPTQKLDRVYA